MKEAKTWIVKNNLKILQFGQYVWAAEIWQQLTENEVQSQHCTQYDKRYYRYIGAGG